MSQATKTTLGSCGLMVGRNMAPPPPGPTTRHRWEPVSEREAGQRRSKQRAVKPARAWSAVRVMCLLESRAVQISRFAANDIPFDTIFLSIMQNMSLALLSNGCCADIFERFSDVQKSEIWRDP